MNLFKRGSLFMRCLWLLFVIFEAAAFGADFARGTGLWWAYAGLIVYGSAFLLWNSGPREGGAKSEPKQIDPKPESLTSRFASGYKPSFREEA